MICEERQILFIFSKKWYMYGYVCTPHTVVKNHNSTTDSTSNYNSMLELIDSPMISNRCGYQVPRINTKVIWEVCPDPKFQDYPPFSNIRFFFSK